MDLIQLNGKIRENTKKGFARELRRNNYIPAIVYGAETKPLMISIDKSEFDKVIRENGTTGLFFNLTIGKSKKNRIVLLKDLQMDVFGTEYMHIDLHEIDMDMDITISIPVETIGESIGVKDGGMLQLVRRELDVVCKPANTPESIKIDVSELAIGDSIHIEDINLGDDVDIPHDVNFTILTVVPPFVEEVEVEEDEEMLEDMEEGTEGEQEDSEDFQTTEE